MTAPSPCVASPCLSCRALPYPVGTVAGGSAFRGQTPPCRNEEGGLRDWMELQSVRGVEEAQRGLGNLSSVLPGEHDHRLGRE